MATIGSPGRSGGLLRVEGAAARLTAATLFVSAFLLFWVQPLVARLALPLLGGVPAVWNTTMVFFQASLLGGYLYAHLLGALRRRLQLGVHAGLLGASLLLLPPGVDAALLQRDAGGPAPGSFSPSRPPWGCRRWPSPPAPAAPALVRRRRRARVRGPLLPLRREQRGEPRRAPRVPAAARAAPPAARPVVALGRRVPAPRPARGPLRGDRPCGRRPPAAPAAGRPPREGRARRRRPPDSWRGGCSWRSSPRACSSARRRT